MRIKHDIRMNSCLRILQQGSRSIELGRSLSKPSAFSTCRRIAQTSQSRPYASIAASEFQFGQPVHETHPHLLKAGEGRFENPGRLYVPHVPHVPHSLTYCTASTVTPGITALEYAHRRSNLASKLPKNSIAILAASEVKFRSGAVFYEFHQDSNFFYLTGMAQFYGGD